MFFIIVCEMRAFVRPYGLRLSSSSDGSSVASASDARVSMMRFTQSICIAFSGESCMREIKRSSHRDTKRANVRAVKKCQPLQIDCIKSEISVVLEGVDDLVEMNSVISWLTSPRPAGWLNNGKGNFYLQDNEDNYLTCERFFPPAVFQSLSGVFPNCGPWSSPLCDRADIRRLLLLSLRQRISTAPLTPEP